MLGSASEEEIQELDHILSLLSNLKTADLTPKPPEPDKDNSMYTTSIAYSLINQIYFKIIGLAV